MRLVFDGFAMQAGERYVDVLNSFRNLLWNAMRQNPSDFRSRTYLKEASLERARVYRDTEIAAFDFALETVASQVEERIRQETGVPIRLEEIEYVGQYLDDIRSFFATELTSQLQRDIGQLERRLSDFSLEYFMAERTLNDPVQAHMTALIDTREQMKFYFKDRSGRRHLSQKFIRTTTRHSLLIAGVELYSIAASYVGNHMEVTHPDGKVNGMKIGFTRAQGYPLLSDVREEVFHPNSDAFLKVVQ